MVSLGLVCCKSKSSQDVKRGDDPVVVDVMVAALQNIDNVVEASGTVIASESVDLHPEVSGRLTYLNIPEGKWVPKGTVLARINSADLEAEYDKSKVQLELEQKTEARLGKLLAVNGINQSDYDAAVSQVKSTLADMDYTRTLIDKTVIRAPFDGTLGLRQISEGAYVTPSTVLATLQQLNHLKVDFTLPDQYSDLVKVGNEVEVEVIGGAEKRQTAKIIAIEPQVNDQTRNLKVRAVLDGNRANPGAFVKVYVSTASTHKMAVMVPTNAIIPNDVNNQMVLVKHGRAEFVDIATGVRMANNVEVIHGVAAGDTVVVDGVLFAKPHGLVHVRSVKTLAALDKLQ
ncbi:MAG: efflux RND transporter periplasmic adaptor subunit [Bacteroidota bacterium]|nr:efflux RND transporter periplasmic adaptor subunit [Bacteroidota bacterium]